MTQCLRVRDSDISIERQTKGEGEDAEELKGERLRGSNRDMRREEWTSKCGSSCTNVQVHYKHKFLRLSNQFRVYIRGKRKDLIHEHITG